MPRSRSPHRMVNDVIISAIIGARPISTGRREPVVGVSVCRSDRRWDPGEARNAGPWGAVGGPEAEKTKRHGGYQWRAAAGGIFATLVKGSDQS